MKFRTQIVALIGASALALGGAAAATAVAAPKSAYPKPIQTYVAHPKGFNDAAEVRVVGGQVKCSVKLQTVSQGDAKVTVRSDLVPLVDELLRITEEKHGYKLKKKATGGYDCRFIRGSSTTPSNHSYGRAVDLNWNDNPMSSTFRSDLPPAVVKLWMEHGFYWGGHYKSRPDAMHFEYVAPRDRIDAYAASARKIGKPDPKTTKTPTAKPTKTPTAKPTKTPTDKPTKTPTDKPTKTPTDKSRSTPTPPWVHPTAEGTPPADPRATDPAPTPGAPNPEATDPATDTTPPDMGDDDAEPTPYDESSTKPEADPKDLEGGLANTGASDHLGALALGGLALIATGVLALRRRP